MRHDFRTRKPATLKTVPGYKKGMSIQDQKSALYNDQYNRRMSPYQNGERHAFGDSMDKPVDDFDWNDLKLKATEVLGYATNNPVAVSAAQSAQSLKKVIASEQKKYAETGKTDWTNLPKEDIKVETSDVYKPGQVSVNWLGFLGPYKIVLVVVAVILLYAVYVRISGK